MRTHRLAVLMLVAAAVLPSAACDRLGTGPSVITMTPMAHEIYFPIVTGNHAVECAQCHGDSGSFKEFRCIDCHEHNEDDMNATHLGFVDYAWDSQRCFACHRRGNVLDEIDHSSFPIRDGAKHALHVEGRADISCRDCHTDPTNRAVVGCTSCHLKEHDLLPMQGVHDGIPSYQWLSASCVTCHPGAKNPGDAEHPFFPTAEGAKHADVSCTECHASREDRTQLACTTCHEQPDTDPPHAGVPDYMYESSSCFLCHPGAEVPGTLAHTKFPIAAGDAHNVVACADCHVNEATRADIGCVTCHENHAQNDMAAVHIGIADYSFESAACLFCHPNAEPTGQIDHAPMFPIATGEVHGPDPAAQPPREAISCSECHTNPSDRQQVGCISCHSHEEPAMAQVHGSMPGYEWSSPACLACHPTGDAAGAIDHSFFPIGNNTQHDGISCATCHIDTNDRAVVGCTSCHDHDAAPMFAIHQGIPTYDWQSADCVRCHPGGQPEGAMDHTAFFPVATGDQHADVTCKECHASQEDRGQLLCTTCHLQPDMAEPHAGIGDYLWESSSCFLCHAKAEVPGVMTHSYFPIASPASHSVVSCAACHTNPTTRADVGCTACHEHEEPAMATVHTGVGGYAWDSSSCLLCHPNSEPTGVIDHTAYFPIESGSAHNPTGGPAITCAECHTNPNVRTEIGCATCHVANDVNPLHTGIPGYEHSSPACLACHPQANKPGSIDHTAMFPIRSADTHGGLACAECHVTQTDRTQLGCTSCHAQPETGASHSLVAGYVWESAQCFACHPQGQATGALDHVPFFPIAQGDVHFYADPDAVPPRAMKCIDCHLDPNDTSVLGCATCHVASETNPIHAAVPAYTHDSPACLTCHPYGEAIGLSGVDHAPFFPIDLGTSHASVGCAECHLDSNNLSVNGCVECHSQTANMGTVHTNVGEFRNAPNHPSSDCKKCHAESQVNLVSAHGPFRISSGRKHYRKNCASCHDQTRTDKPWATDFVPFSCNECHSKNQMDDKHSGENGYSYDFPTCLNCHARG